MAIGSDEQFYSEARQLQRLKNATRAAQDELDDVDINRRLRQAQIEAAMPIIKEKQAALGAYAALRIVELSAKNESVTEWQAASADVKSDPQTL